MAASIAIRNSRACGFARGAGAVKRDRAQSDALVHTVLDLMSLLWASDCRYFLRRLGPPQDSPVLVQSRNTGQATAITARQMAVEPPARQSIDDSSTPAGRFGLLARNPVGRVLPEVLEQVAHREVERRVPRRDRCQEPMVVHRNPLLSLSEEVPHPHGQAALRPLHSARSDLPRRQAASTGQPTTQASSFIGAL